MNEKILQGDFPGMQALVNEVLIPVLRPDDFDIEDYIDITEDYADKAKNAHIQEVRRYTQSISFGVYALEFYEIILEDRCDIRHARVGIQSIIRSEMQSYSNALIVFHYATPDNRTWRLSYVNKGKSQADSTSAKRYTYLLGKNYTSRTFIERLRVLQKTTCIDEEALLNAFSVEALSNEFFDEYKVFYEDIVQYISGTRFVEVSKNKYERREGFLHDKTIFATFLQQTGNDQAAAEKLVRDYVKKLLGRLVFLQFLQKKGWMGVPASQVDWSKGDVRFMHNLFLKATPEQQADYINRILNPLFFRCLNEQRENDLFDTQVCAYGADKGLVRIPYLNGGLFEQEPVSDIAVPLPSYFFSNEAQQDTARTFSKTTDKAHYPYDHACGLFDFFDRYNFTIDENDPDDAEVGVDPEMLGKIFENLLEDNKDKGAFYTPKEIVRYMCEESLVAYLETECPSANKADLRSFITTSTVPSAWLMKSADGQRLNVIAQQAMTALREVKICDPAIGSGAFPMGLLNILYRCGKAMDEYYPDHAGKEEDVNAKIKRHIIQNNIYGVDIEKGAVDIARLRFWLALIVDELSPEALPNLDYKIMQGNSLLESYKGIDLSNLFPKKITQQGNNQPGTQKEVFDDQLDEDRKNLPTLINEYYDTSDHAKKAEKRKQIEKNIIKQLQTQRYDTKDFEENKIDIAANSQFFLWHTWFSDVFNRSTKQGFDIVIGNPPYIDSEMMTRVMPLYRKIYSKKYECAVGNWDMFVLFIELSKTISKENGVYAFIVPNKLIAAKYTEKLRNYITNDIIEVRDYGKVSVFANAAVYPATILGINNTDIKREVRFSLMKNLVEKDVENGITSKMFATIKYWDIIFRQPKEFSIFTKISAFPLLKENSRVTITGAATVAEAYKLKSILQDNPKKQDSVKVINTGTIDKYVSLWGVVPMQYIKDKYKYPTVSKSQLLTLSKTRYNQACYEKIIVAGMSKNIEAVYDNGETLAGKSTSIIIGDTTDLLFILGFINSTLLSYFTQIAYNSLKMAGGFINIGVRELEQLPIPTATPTQQQPIIELVDKILTAKKAEPQADTTAQERQIDELVYQLYGLTDSEIQIIEGK